MKEKDIALNYDFDVNKIPLKNTDIVIVMGNLLDNAIEAAKKCEEGKKYINITIKNINQFFILKIKNSCVKKAVVKNERFISDKLQKQKHGLGIESVKHIITSYNGEMSFLCDEEIFEVKIIINE